MRRGHVARHDGQTQRQPLIRDVIGGPKRVPLVLMAGRDHKGQPLPEGCDAHWLAGYKAAELTYQGQPLICEIVRRVRACGWFYPIHVAGPAAVFGPLLTDVILIDTDGELDENLRAALMALGERRIDPVAFLATDILPEVASLRQLMTSFANGPRSAAVYFPLVRMPGDPAELGASGYKPRYRLLLSGGEETAVFPGHLLIFRPRAIRLNLVYSLVRLAYRSRNIPVRRRTIRMLVGAICFLVKEDARLLLRGRWPHITATVVRNALIVSRSLQRGRISRASLARRLRAVFIRATYRLRHPQARVWLPLCNHLDLAKDIDTHEEALSSGLLHPVDGQSSPE